jgi:hypothetical protein
MCRWGEKLHFSLSTVNRVTGKGEYFHPIGQGCRMVYFQTKNSNSRKILEGLEMEHVGLCNGYLEYIKAVCYVLRAYIW